MKEHLQEIIFEKNAEIERLKSEIEQLRSTFAPEMWADHEREIADKEAVIERLNAEIDGYAAAFDQHEEAIEAKDAEIERLKDELPECQMCATINSSDGWYCAECAGAWDVKTVKDAEIERLKGELDCCSQHSTTQVRVVRDLHARLAAAVECAEGYTDILWTMEINDFANEILDKLRGEE